VVRRDSGQVDTEVFPALVITHQFAPAMRRNCEDLLAIAAEHRSREAERSIGELNWSS